jgi:hypothetical protein
MNKNIYIIIRLFSILLIVLFTLTNCESQKQYNFKYRYEVDGVSGTIDVTILDSNQTLKKFDKVNSDWSYSWQGHGKMRPLSITASGEGKVTVYIYRNNGIVSSRSGSPSYLGYYGPVTAEGTW